MAFWWMHQESERIIQGRQSCMAAMAQPYRSVGNGRQSLGALGCDGSKETGCFISREGKQHAVHFPQFATTPHPPAPRFQLFQALGPEAHANPGKPLCQPLWKHPHTAFRNHQRAAASTSNALEKGAFGFPLKQLGKRIHGERLRRCRENPRHHCGQKIFCHAAPQPPCDKGRQAFFWLWWPNRDKWLHHHPQLGGKGEQLGKQ